MNALISIEQIETIAALLPEKSTEKRKPGRPRKNFDTVIDVPAWVSEYIGHISVVAEKDFAGGKLYILSECPFDSQHSAPDSVIGQQASGAVFFKCFHSSCQKYDWHELRKQFASEGDSCRPEEQVTRLRNLEKIHKHAEIISGSELPVIELVNRQLRDVTAEVIEAIHAAGKIEPLLYVQDGRLVRIVAGPDQSPRLNIAGIEAMPEIMSRSANFVRTGASGAVGVFPPDSLAKAIVHRGHWPFPVLRGITETLVLRKDGSILNKAGYDIISGLYYHSRGSIPRIPEAPTRKDAESAAEFLLDILSDFPFQDESSRDNALGLLLTVVVKEIVGLSPMVLIDAPTKGTGKTRLAQLTAIAATGYELPLSPEVRDEEEWRKQITSLLIADRPVIILDNIERTLCSAQLAAILTTSEWSDRLLGKSEVLHLHSRSIWIATGNNIRLGGDITRRVYWIRLNANLPRPWMRDSGEFKRELPAWAILHRMNMIASLLTMVRAWFLDGSPAWSGRPLGSYELWSRTVGGILEYCGLKEFLSNLEDLYEQADEELTQWNVFFGAVFEAFGEGSSFSTKALLERISGKGGEFSPPQENDFLKSRLPDSLGEPEERGFSRRLGLALRKYKDRLFELEQGLVLLKEGPPDRHRQKSQWTLVRTAEGQNSAPSAPSAPRYNSNIQDEK